MGPAVLIPPEDLRCGQRTTSLLSCQVRREIQQHRDEADMRAKQAVLQLEDELMEQHKQRIRNWEALLPLVSQPLQLLHILRSNPYP